MTYKEKVSDLLSRLNYVYSEVEKLEKEIPTFKRILYSRPKRELRESLSSMLFINNYLEQNSDLADIVLKEDTTQQIIS